MATFLNEGFVVSDSCNFTISPPTVLLDGEIRCLGGILLEVQKAIEIVEGRGPTALVQTRTFGYHGWVRGGRNILRYESACGHRQHPHKHIYDYGTGREVEVIDITDPERVPVLSEVIRELEQWHTTNAHLLAVPLSRRNTP